MLNIKVGEVWYVNAVIEHSVRNNGVTDRIHLVIDCEANNWLRSKVNEGLVVY